MDIDKTHNPYHAPRGRVTSTNTSQGISPVIAEVLGSAAIWARFTSIVNWISLGMTALSIAMVLFSLFFGGASISIEVMAAAGTLVGIILVYLPQAIAYWYYARSLSTYASSAKALRDGVLDEDDVARCFASSSTFMKTTFFFCFLFIIIAAIGILAAIALPAYQDYVMRVQGQ